MSKSLSINYNYCPYCGFVLDEKIEENKARNFCPKCNWTHYPTESMAPCGILMQDDKILLVQRNRAPRRFKWQLPSGFKDHGETSVEALKRELQEELGVQMTKAKFVEELRSSKDPRNSGVIVSFYVVR
ncbi:MAG: NUDIX domain-containing protein, partial [Candidatus Yanofskybacteria bacterium]|nr:NUDIX domain-containing protein [Candidatus Yanofskybacteria bacterium]